MFQAVKSAAAELSISESFLRGLIRANKIPFYRLSERTLRVDVNELRAFMRRTAENQAQRKKGSEQ